LDLVEHGVMPGVDLVPPVHINGKQAAAVMSCKHIHTHTQKHINTHTHTHLYTSPLNRQLVCPFLSSCVWWLVMCVRSRRSWEM